MTTEVINGIEVTDFRSPPSPIPDSLEELREHLNKLSEERDVIQKEIENHSEVLRREKNVGMEGALLDEDQYPRDDIDVVAVRTSRQQLICLTNDMRGVMERVERALFKLHQLLPSQAQGDAAAPAPVSTRPPFLRVHGVLADSPAHMSGLRDEDLICQMGSLHKDNFTKLPYHLDYKNNCAKLSTRSPKQSIQTGLGDVAEVVKLSLNKAVPVKLTRDGTPKTIALKPRTWQGKGVLGCNVVEFQV